MRDAILSGFSEDTFVEVKDISGGCGSMYAIEVESLDFKGVSKVKQSRMVNDLIKKEIGEVSGVFWRVWVGGWFGVLFVFVLFDSLRHRSPSPPPYNLPVYFIPLP